jgi:hypothetical protein
LHNTFNSVARGITYWHKHRHHICYKCRKYGHIAKDCSKICQACGNLHNNTVCVYSIEKLFRRINNKLTNGIIRDPQDLTNRIQQCQAEIKVEDLRESQFPKQKLKITSSNFTLDKKQKTKMDSLFDEIEQETTTTKRRNNRKTRQNILREIKSEPQLTINLGGEYEYKFEKSEMPTLRKLQLELALDTLNKIKKQTDKQITIYKEYIQNKNNISKMRKKLDDLFGETEAQKIKLKNVIERKNNIYKEKDELFNRYKEKAQARAKKVFERDYAKAKKAFKKKKVQFNQRKDQWYKENGWNQQDYENMKAWYLRYWKVHGNHTGSQKTDEEAWVHNRHNYYCDKPGCDYFHFNGHRTANIHYQTTGHKCKKDAYS